VTVRRSNSARKQVLWQGVPPLASLAGKPQVQIELRNADLFAL
jgi:hypothetical protein